MARRRSASLQARHAPGCALGKPWTPFDQTAGCTCRKLNGRGPVYYVVSRPAGAVTKTGKPQQVREEIGYDREDARRKLLAVLGAIDDGTHAAPRRITFSEFAEEWSQPHAS